MAKKSRINPESALINGGKPVIRKPKKQETDIPLTDAQRFLQDIQLHQVELEIQNEELRTLNLQSASQLQKYIQLFDSAPVALFILSSDGQIQDLNFQGEKLLGNERSSMINKPFESFLCDESRPEFSKHFHVSFEDHGTNGNSVILSKDDETKGINQLELRMKSTGTMIKDVRVNFKLLQSADKFCMLSIREDVPGKRHAEAVKKEQLFWTREYYKSIGVGSFCIDFINDSWTSSEITDEIIGIPATAERTITSFLSCIHPVEKAGFQYYLFSEVIARKQPFDKQFRIIRSSDQAERVVRGTGTLEFDDSGMLSKLSGSIQDITEPGDPIAGISALGSKDHILINSVPEGIVVFDHEGKISEVSDLIQVQSGFQHKDDLIGKHFLLFVPWRERSKILSLIERTTLEDRPQREECSLFKAGNSQIIAEISLSKVIRKPGDHPSYIAIIKDVTEQKKKEKQLIHLDRMAHLGEMATGMAHEINQPLNNISLTLDNIFHEIKLKDSLHDAYLQHKANKVFDNIIKIKNLIEHVREFARDGQNYSLHSFHINEIIRNALSTINIQLDEKRIDLVLDLEDSLDHFTGNSFKLEQAILNLLLNARDALEEKEKKETGAFPKVIKIKSYQEKSTIFIEITDSGIGMKASELEKIMLPFHTTKETGKGIGLGLSISYGILSEMNGKIDVESKYMVGSTFRISIPCPNNEG